MVVAAEEICDALAACSSTAICMARIAALDQFDLISALVRIAKTSDLLTSPAAIRALTAIVAVHDPFCNTLEARFRLAPLVRQLWSQGNDSIKVLFFGYEPYCD